MTEEIKWFDTPVGKYRVQQSRLGLYTSYDEEGKGQITGPTEDAVHVMTPFHMDGMVNGFLKEEMSYEGVVGGKL